LDEPTIPEASGTATVGLHPQRWQPDDEDGRRMALDPRPEGDIFVVGIGGSTREGSSTERVVDAVLDALKQRGAETRLYAGQALVLPPYEQTYACADACANLLADVRRAHGLVVGSPGYHGTISGLVKNVLDYLEELRSDDPPYLDRKAVGCVTTAYGWQAAVNTLTTLRQVVHSLRGWPTPYGIALNAAGGLIGEDGSFTDPRNQQGVDIMADQIFEFARAMRFLRTMA
jgi:FMN reductase